MAIVKKFGSASIRKPGSYSKSRVDNSSGAPLASNNTLFIFGESQLGRPGSSEGIVQFNASQVNNLVEKYGKGPISDAALAAIRPASSSLIGGAGKIFVYKTNASTQASLSVNDAADANILMYIKDKAWGQPGNNISVSIANGSVPATQKIITINKIGLNSEVLPENDGQSQLSIQYTGDATTAVINITGASKSAKVIASTLAGDQTDGSLDFSISIGNLKVNELVDQINALSGYSCLLVDTAKGTVNAGIDLDLVSAANIKAGAVDFYRLQEEIIEVINDNSDYCEAVLDATPRIGLPVNISGEFLSGGAQGASSNSNFSSALSDSLSVDYNIALPLVSQDASADISLGPVPSDGFVTDAASAYTVASVLAALKAHLNLRGQIKNKKEAQGFAGFRSATKAACYTEARTLASELVQMCIQDCKILDLEGNLTWKQPHILAAIAAGIRLGTDVGEPLTYKYVNVQDIGHDMDMAVGGDESEDGDFDPNTDYDDAIDAGVLFVENVSSAWRWVVDNTTYGADQSFVWNRGSVIEAAQYVAKTLRATAELVFVGQKVSNGAAVSIKNVLRNKLIELNQPEVNIITSSLGAPQGFKEDTFVVNVTGNTAEVQIEIVPVQGLDFVFISFVLGDIRQSA